MNAKKIRNWCLIQPRPKKLRIHCADDAIRELESPTKGVNWQQIANTIEALDPHLLEAYDSNGNLLRALKSDDDDDSDDDPRLPINPEIQLPPVLANDPETARLTHFSNLLFRAQQFSTQVAFEKLVSIFEILEQRSANQDARLERTEAHLRRVQQSLLDDAFDRAENAGASAAQQPDGGNPLVDAFLKSWVQGQAAKAAAGAAASANGTTNGKPNGGKS